MHDYTTIVVNPVPLAIGGTSMQVCAGATQVLFDGTTAGAWSSIKYGGSDDRLRSGRVVRRHCGDINHILYNKHGLCGHGSNNGKPAAGGDHGADEYLLRVNKDAGRRSNGRDMDERHTTIASVVIPAAGVIEGTGLGAGDDILYIGRRLLFTGDGICAAIACGRYGNGGRQLLRGRGRCADKAEQLNAGCQLPAVPRGYGHGYLCGHRRGAELRAARA